TPIRSPLDSPRARSKQASCEAADEGRARHQSEDRAGARAHPVAVAAPPRRPGHRVMAVDTRRYFAATPAISTKYPGAARRASTVARAGGLAGSIQPSHTLFMSS